MDGVCLVPKQLVFVANLNGTPVASPVEAGASPLSLENPAPLLAAAVTITNSTYDCAAAAAAASGQPASPHTVFYAPLPRPHVLDVVKVGKMRDVPDSLRSSRRFDVIPPPLTAATASARFRAFRNEVVKSAKGGDHATVHIVALEPLVSRQEMEPGMAEGWRTIIGDLKQSPGAGFQLARKPRFADGGNQTLLAVYLDRDDDDDSNLTAEVLQDPRSTIALVRTIAPRCAVVATPALSVAEQQAASESAMATDAAVASLLGGLPQLTESDLIASQATASARQLEGIAAAAAAVNPGYGSGGGGKSSSAPSINTAAVPLSIDTVAQAMADAYQAFLAAESAAAASTPPSQAIENSPLYSADVLAAVDANSVAASWTASLRAPGVSLSELVCALPEVASFRQSGDDDDGDGVLRSGRSSAAGPRGNRVNGRKTRRPSRADQALLQGTGSGVGGDRRSRGLSIGGKQTARVRKLQSQVPVDTILAKLKSGKSKRGIGHGGGSSSGNEGSGGNGNGNGSGGALLKHYASYDSNSGSGSGGGARLRHHASFESYGSEDRHSTSSPVQGSSSSGFGRMGLPGAGAEPREQYETASAGSAGAGAGASASADDGAPEPAPTSWRVQAQKARQVPFAQALTHHHPHGVSYATESGVKEHAKLGKLQSKHVRQDSESKPAALESSRLRSGFSSLGYSSNVATAAGDGGASILLDESSFSADQAHFSSVFDSSAGRGGGRGGRADSGGSLGIGHDRVADIIRKLVERKMEGAGEAEQRETTAVLHEMSLPLQRMWPNDAQLGSRVEQFVQANIALIASIPE